jgi:hypothetical protein
MGRISTDANASRQGRIEMAGNDSFMFASLAEVIESNEIFTVKDTARTSVRTDLIPMTIQAVEEDAFFVYEAGMALMSFLQTYGFRLKFPPANRYRGHKSEAARKKREEAKLRKK